MDHYELTSSQKRLWFEWKFDQDSIAYNASVQYKLYGEVKKTILERAVNLLTAQFASLRTYFVEHDGLPKQSIMPEVKIEIETHDIRSTSVISRFKHANSLLSKCLDEPFCLFKPPLHRYILIQIDKNEWILGLTWHHIIIDAPSVRFLLKNLCNLYNKMCKGESLPVLDSDISIADILIIDKNNSMNGSMQGVQYWDEKIKGISFGSPFLSNTKIENRKYKGKRIHVKLEDILSKNILATVKLTRTTLFIFITAVLKTILFRFSNQNDIIVGYSVSWREQLIRNQVGFFVNALPLRTVLDSCMKFSDLIESINQQRKNDILYQQVPLVDILAFSRKAQKKDIDTLFNIIVNQSLAISDPLSLENINSTCRYIRDIEPQVDFMIRFDRSDVIEFDFEFDISKLDEWYIQRIIKSFLYSLRYISENSYIKICDIPLLTPLDLSKVITFFNRTEFNYDQSKCLSELIEAEVQKAPAAIALVCEKIALNYEELNVQANQLAHYLRRLGVGKETIVGISLERSPELIIGLLAILKAGGAYVPLDPSYPEERLKWVLMDAKPLVLVTNSQLYDKFTGYKGYVINVDEIKKDLLKESRENPTLITTAKDLAYVIYTSGSTGKPKGVMIEHNSLINNLMWMKNQYNITKLDRILQKTSISFDVSLWELFLPFISGGTMVMTAPGTHQRAKELASLIQRETVTLLHFVPSMLNLFLEEPEIKNCCSIKKVFCSGEALSIELKERFYQRLPGRELHNLYGPTEATVHVTSWNCAALLKSETVPIGRPIWNTKIYLLDKNQSPVPIGVIGELYIGGAGVARGYWNQPKLTAERFIIAPFSQDKERLYKTGDLARYLPDGNIEYIGRVDEQVKVRGFRIELGEIESNLVQYEGVNQAVVVVRESELREKYLAAYIVPNLLTEQTEEALVSSLRHYLAQRLPEYMLPNAYQLLKIMPLTPSGKIDRKALPELLHKRLVREEYTEPEGEIERAIANIWVELLAIEKAGRHDNFFSLGGHSLLAVRLINKISTIFKRDISLALFLENPTISNLAHYLHSEDNFLNKLGNALLPINTQGSEAPLFLIHPISGLAFPYLHLQKLINDRPIYGINNPFFFLTDKKFETIEEMASNYVVTIKDTQNKGPYIVGGWSFGGVIALEVAHQLMKNGDEVKAVLLIDTYNPEKINTINEPKRDLLKSICHFFDHSLRQEGISLNNEQKYWLEQEVQNNLNISSIYRSKMYDFDILLIKERNNLIQGSYNGWENYFNMRKVHVSYVDISHNLIFNKEHVPQIAAILKNYLNVLGLKANPQEFGQF